MTIVARFWRDEVGSSAIEYGLLAGIISCLIIAGLQKIGARLTTKLQSLQVGFS